MKLHLKSYWVSLAIWDHNQCYLPRDTSQHNLP